MSTSTVTSDSPRTLRRIDWASSIEKTTILPNKISSVVRTCMSTLIQSPLRTAHKIQLSPWLGKEEVEIHGAMWAGVPFVKQSWQEEDGSWMITCYTPSGSVSEPRSYLRLSPAEKDAEAQYGMCIVRMNRFPVLAKKLLGPRKDWQVKFLEVLTSRNASFRIDKIITSAIRLSSLEDQSAAGKEFKTLLGETSLYVFVDSLSGKCYGDTASSRDILKDTSALYQRMVHLVALHAYPQLFSPTLEMGLNAFNSILNLGSVDNWVTPAVWPYVYTVFMPQEIFDRVSHSLEKEIPPLVPMCVTGNSWMFNGQWSSPCTGLDILDSVKTTGRGNKILSGVLNSFNLDLPGDSFFWCPNHGCPGQNWVDTFLKVADDIVAHTTGWDTSYKRDMSLFSSRKIPVLFDTVSEGKPLSRYAILQDVKTRGDGTITSVETCECDSTGKPLEGKEEKVTVSSSPPPDTKMCTSCRNVHNTDDLVPCYECRNLRCQECLMHCSACREVYCDACFGHSTHNCSLCYRCEELFSLNNLGECPGCREQVCSNCHDYECCECGTVFCEACYYPPSEHDCTAGRRMEV